MFRPHSWVLSAIPVVGIAGALFAATTTCDLNGDGSVNVADLQLVINEAMGASPPVHDLNGDGIVNVADIQIALDAVLHEGCASDNSPTLTFPAIPTQALGISPFVISARAVTGVTHFSSTTAAVCSVADDLVTLSHTGTCSVAAGQPGTSATTTRSFTVKLTQAAAAFAAVTGSPIPVGTNPNSVAAGDFNGDGVPDLAIANEMSSNVTVLLGNGSGGFTAAPNSPIAVSGGPVAVAVGDFNGDGYHDLAVANLNGNNVAILLGDGAGRFAPVPGSPFTTGTNPDFVAIGDFNGDGVQDLVVSNLNSNNVTVFLGNGAGGFTAASGSPITVGTSPQAVALGDFNGDGKLDLAVANYSGSISILLGNGAGGFTAASGSPLASGGMTASVVTGDFNGDGIADLAAGTYDTGSVAVFLGNGSGGFTAVTGSPFPAGAGRGVITVADFNGDGVQDLVVANANANNVAVLLGNGAGKFTAMSGSPFAAGTEPVCVAVADFNRDGIEDIAVVNLLSSNLTVLLGSAH
jgi:hypothetical protein